MPDYLSWVRSDPETYPNEFVVWVRDNPHIVDAFFHQADTLRQRGRTHYSARTIIEYLRHHTILTETHGDWKINDHSVPYLSRLYADFRPAAKDFFSRRLTNLERSLLAEAA